ncbi:MAG: hypothetical protein ACE5FK_11130, partial [Candidatus Methylomirabilia bacterium]
MMVIEAGTQPRVLAPFTRERDRAIQAIKAARARDIPTRVTEAIGTAKSLTGQDSRLAIHVFTDGAFPRATEELKDSRINWVGVGERNENVGITNLAIRKTYFGAFDYEAFLSVVNFSGDSQTFTFLLELDDRPITKQSLTLKAHVRRQLVLPFSHQDGGVVAARLDVVDDLAADNVAYAVIPPPRQIRVLLVSEGNLFLEKSLRVDPQVALEVRSAEAYQGEMEGFDVVVLDSVSPSRLGGGRFVLVNSAPPDVPIEVLGRMKQPIIMDWERSHPILRHVDLSKVVIEEALRVRPLAAGKALVEAVGGPLLYALEEPRRKAVFVGFDLFQSDLPLRVAFPLIISNSLRWLHPAGLDQSSLQIRAGEPILLPVEHGVDTVSIKGPSGRRGEVAVTRGVVNVTGTDEVGVYTVATANGETSVAVNLVNAEESDLTPRLLPPPAAGARAVTPAVPVQRELWPLFVLLAALILGLEGLLFWRRQSGGRLRVPAGIGER